MKKEANQLISDSLDNFTQTNMYFEYLSSKDLENLQQEILKRVNCEDCGWCCSSCNVLLTEDDIITLCKYLGCKFDEFYDKYMDKETVMNYLKFPCPFLDMEKDKKCIIYESRPTICKNFPFNSSLLVIDPCKIGKKLVEIIDFNIADKMLSKMNKKELKEFKKKLKRDKVKADNTIDIYNKLEAFYPQFNKIPGHLVAIIDKEMLEKIEKELRITKKN